MLVKDYRNCREIRGIDNAIIRELLKPSRDNIDIGYSLALANVKPKETTYLHRVKNSEVYYILEGEGEMYIDDEVEKVSEGQAIYIPPNSAQKIKNIGKRDLIFLCIVYPPWKPEDEEIVEE
ncbi:MAG TPA: cupin domain-containing protein [Thermoplasmatales archaeon]|nr:cupin domain-containing protein [Thermoplasmatales archaeon]